MTEEQLKRAAIKYGKDTFGGWGKEHRGVAVHAFIGGYNSNTVNKELLEMLREIVSAEWMVTHDWGGDRDSILNKAKELLTKYSNENGTK